MTARITKQTDGPPKGRLTRPQRRAAQRSEAKRRPARVRLPLAQITGGLVATLAVAAIVIYAILRTNSVVHPSHHASGPALTNAAGLHPGSMPKPGHVAPTFILRGINGRDYNLSAQRGHPVLLEFFATWCPHCQHEAPIVERLKNRYAPRGVRIWAILASPYGPNYDASYGQDTTPATKSDLIWFSRTFGEHVPQLVDPTFHVVNEYGVSGYPGFFVTNKRGVIVYEQSGDQSYSMLSTALDKALSGA